MAEKGGGYVRVKDRTQRAIRMLVGKLQIERGNEISADDALWYVFKRYMPGIAGRAEEAQQPGKPKQTQGEESA